MKRWWLRIGLALMGVLGSYVGVSVLLFVLGTHRTSLSQQPHEWLPLHPFEPDRRLLVIAPHPDDEVLGCGGLIAEAVQRGIPVKVVWLTAGDAFAGAAMLLSRTTPDSQDYRHLGKKRMEEAREASRRLGVPEENLLFLGYPDRRLWQMALSGQTSVRSATTGYHRVAYSDCVSPSAEYTATNLILDLRRILEAFQPTDIFTAHPLDDHLDHMACALFTMEAIRQAVQAQTLSQRPRLFYYLVHRGDWPLPQGDYPHRKLLPPVSMAQSGWFYLPLAQDTLARKRSALEAHETQYALMTRFLCSFLRQNELFQRALEPQYLYRNSVDDNPALRLRPEGDISLVQIAPETHGLWVRVTTRQPIKAPLQMEFRLITVDTQSRMHLARWVYRPNGKALLAQRDGNALQVWLPVSHLLRQQAGYLVVQTRLYGVEIDRSGVLPIRLSEAGWDSPASAIAPQFAP